MKINVSSWNPFVCLWWTCPSLFTLFWPHLVAFRILVSWLWIEPLSLAVKAWSSNPWTARESPCSQGTYDIFFNIDLGKYLFSAAFHSDGRLFAPTLSVAILPLHNNRGFTQKVPRKLYLESVKTDAARGNRQSLLCRNSDSAFRLVSLNKLFFN